MGSLRRIKATEQSALGDRGLISLGEGFAVPFDGTQAPGYVTALDTLPSHRNV